jgi:hypothetical protein
MKGGGVMQIRVTLNGSPTNPWHQYGLKANPFPQIPKAEFRTANEMLQRLDSDPLTSTDDIRRILDGCDSEFVDLCCRVFKPGERISFDVTWP